MSNVTDKTADRATQEAKLETLTGDESNMSATQKAMTADIRANHAAELAAADNSIPREQGVAAHPNDLPYGIRTAPANP